MPSARNLRTGAANQVKPGTPIPKHKETLKTATLNLTDPEPKPKRLLGAPCARTRQLARHALDDLQQLRLVLRGFALRCRTCTAEALLVGLWCTSAPEDSWLGGLGAGVSGFRNLKQGSVI